MVKIIWQIKISKTAGRLMQVKEAAVLIRAAKGTYPKPDENDALRKEIFQTKKGDKNDF